MSDSEPITTTNLTVSGNLTIASGTNVSGLAFDKVSGLKSALAGKANLVSPALVGVPTAPTAVPTVSNTQIATTAFVQKAVTDIVGAAPPLLNTLTELAGALGGDADFKTTVTDQLALKAPLDSPTFTGTVTGITKAMVGLGNVDNTTDLNKPVSLLTQSALDAKVTNSASTQFAGNAATVTNGVYTTGDQTIGGTKTFSSTIGGSISGNAATATKLANAITIAGQAFDGAANITIASSNLSDGSNLATKTYVGGIVAAEKVTVGYLAGNNAQQTAAIAIGRSAGGNAQGTQAVAIGVGAGFTAQGASAVAIGYSAGYTAQGTNAVAIGYEAGQHNQAESTVAIGKYAGNSGQRSYAVAIGIQAGISGQGQNGVAIGDTSGAFQQSQNAVAIGVGAGYGSQGTNAIAIGAGAGYQSQGANAIAIGNSAGYWNQHANSIVINATGDTVNSAAGGAFHVAPIRSGNGFSLLYDTDTKEITHSSAKSFVIDHPTNDNKYLVHVCLEGPESGVYYRGEGEIVNNLHTTIHLPAYVERLATEFTIQITQIYSGKKMESLYTSRVENNSFVVYGENCEFYWHVTGKRGDVEVEPSKDNTNVKGSGPYKWIE
jgi:hypothetical protein